MAAPPPSADARLNVSAGVASVAVALVLVLLKLWGFAQTGALSIAATLVDSGLDLLMSGAGLLAMVYASRPADDDHAFGHTSAEDLAALAQAAFILASAGVIGTAAVRRLLDPGAAVIREEGAGALVLVLSILVTAALVVWQRRVAARTGSRVVLADSLHYVSDLLPNLGALVALWASAAFGLGQVDSVVGLATAAVLVAGAARIGRHAFDALMDRQASPEVIEGIAAIAQGFPGVKGFHDLRTRTSGSRIFVNIHVELDGRQTLDEAHAIGAALRRAIVGAYPRADVIVHKDPVGVQPHPDDPRGRA